MLYHIVHQFLLRAPRLFIVRNLVLLFNTLQRGRVGICWAVKGQGDACVDPSAIGDLFRVVKLSQPRRRRAALCLTVLFSCAWYTIIFLIPDVFTAACLGLDVRGAHGRNRRRHLLPGTVFRRRTLRCTTLRRFKDGNVSPLRATVGVAPTFCKALVYASSNDRR